MEYNFMNDFLSLFGIGFLTSTIRMSTPLILGGIGAVFSERSGILNLGIEGTMLMSAFAAAATSFFTSNPWLGVLGGALTGAIIGLLHVFMCTKFKANQTVIGTGINIMAMGIPPLILAAIWGNPGSTPAVPTLRAISIPGLANIPVIGDIIGKQNPLTYLALILVPASTFFLFKTKTGLRIRAIGEHPLAADTLGVDVFALQYLCLILCGIFAGIGGAYLSICQISMFVKGMTNGRGFMAMAAMIFGNWKPKGVLIASLLFGLADSLQMSIQTAGWGIPTDLLLCLPYVITIIVLAGFVGKAVPPKHVGKPYIKQ
jgi:ABC-type uncharacterized transport system permease subunit